MGDSPLPRVGGTTLPRLWLSFDVRHHCGTMKIRIIKTPPGEAPEDVRVAWVGLELPLVVSGAHTIRISGVISRQKTLFGKLLALLTGKAKHRKGYIVDAAQAVEVLAARSPQAAKWWRENAALSIQPGKRFLFAAEACQEVAGEKPDLDESVLIQLKEAGSDFSKPHHIEFFLYFPTQAIAEQAAPKIKVIGFDVEVRQAAQGSDWLCYTTKTMVPDLSALQKIRTDFNDLAASLGGQYDGWGTPVVN